MSKIAITGHTTGIGQALFDNLSKNHKCHGFSISNGFDITKNNNLLLNGIARCDVFINNAYAEDAQMKLLLDVFNIWQNDSTKTIVNISSSSKYPGHSFNLSGYPGYKAALSHQAGIMQQMNHRLCRIINVNPGYVDTPRVSMIDKPKLTTQECADIIIFAIEQPQHIEIGELGFWIIDK